MWRLYRQPGDNDILDRPGFAKITAFERAKLFRIIHGAILIYCGSRGKVTAEGLLGIYERYMAWKERLSPELRYDEGEPLPHVLFLQ